MPKLLYTLNCRFCNPHEKGCEPVIYDDPQKRDYEARQHADKFGHTLDAGITFA